MFCRQNICSKIIHKYKLTLVFCSVPEVQIIGIDGSSLLDQFLHFIDDEMSALGDVKSTCVLRVDLRCVYQAVHGPLIPLVPLDALVFHSLLQLVKNVVLVFAFVFCHKAGKLLLQGLPGNLTGGQV